MVKKKLRPARRFYRCIKEMVNLTAEVKIIKLGQEKYVQLSKWKDYDKKDACGYKCNYLFDAPSCNCNAGDEKEVTTFKPGIHLIFPEESTQGK